MSDDAADIGLAALKLIRAEFETFCDDRGHVSETDTRVKVIDRVLKEVFQWPESLLSREDNYSTRRLVEEGEGR